MISATSSAMARETAMRCFGKTGGVELACHGARAERLADRDLVTGHEIDDIHAVRPTGVILEVSLHNATDAFAVAQQGAREVGEQGVDVVFRPIENCSQMIGVDVLKVRRHGDASHGWSYKYLTSLF